MDARVFLLGTIIKCLGLIPEVGLSIGMTRMPGRPKIFVGAIDRPRCAWSDSRVSGQVAELSFNFQRLSS